MVTVFLSYGEIGGLSVERSLNYTIGIMCISEQNHNTRYKLGEIYVVNSTYSLCLTCI